MDLTAPHYLLFSRVDSADGSGQWRFLLRPQDGQPRFEADDVEPDVPGERLDLLTVVRALESLDQPSRVTLVECSDYVWKGIRYGLSGMANQRLAVGVLRQMVPVKNSDLWQRLDRALRFHRRGVPARRRFDRPIIHQEECSRSTAPLDCAVGRAGRRGRLSDWVKYAAKLRACFKTGRSRLNLPTSQVVLK